MIISGVTFCISYQFLIFSSHMMQRLSLVKALKVVCLEYWYHHIVMEIVHVEFAKFQHSIAHIEGFIHFHEQIFHFDPDQSFVWNV